LILRRIPNSRTGLLFIFGAETFIYWPVSVDFFSIYFILGFVTEKERMKEKKTQKEEKKNININDRNNNNTS